MGEIIPIVSQQQAEDAWESYASLARELVTRPSLLTDRNHMDLMRRAERRWKDIANRLEA